MPAYQQLSKLSTRPPAPPTKHSSPPPPLKVCERLKPATLVTEAPRAFASWDCHCVSLHTSTGTEVVHRCGLPGWLGWLGCCLSPAIPAVAAGLHRVAPHAAHRHVVGAGAFLDAVGLQVECLQVRGTHLREGRLSCSDGAVEATDKGCRAQLCLETCIPSMLKGSVERQQQSRSNEAKGTARTQGPATCTSKPAPYLAHWHVHSTHLDYVIGWGVRWPEEGVDCDTGLCRVGCLQLPY